MSTLTCRTCGKVKDLEQFIKRGRTKDGLRGLCKSCKSESDKQYRIKNKDKLSEYYSKKWRDDPERRERNRLSKELRRTGMNATEYVKSQSCEICGMTNPQHREKYGERLHIHHEDNNGRKNIRQGEDPIHENLTVLCRSCHVSVDNKNRSYEGRGHKAWETRRRNERVQS